MAKLNLKRLYNQLNAKWFDGALPKDTHVEWADLRSNKCIGLYTPGHPALIQVCERLRDVSNTVVEFTLIHECVHHLHDVKGVAAHGRGGWHGKAFQQEMMVLAIRGCFSRLW